MDRSRSSNTSAALLPGAGHTPSYGINESNNSTSLHGSTRSTPSDSQEHWGVVTYCALTACVISMVTGMSISYSSIIINDLSKTKITDWKITTDGTPAIVIGVGFYIH